MALTPWYQGLVNEVVWKKPRQNYNPSVRPRCRSPGVNSVRPVCRSSPSRNPNLSLAPEGADETLLNDWQSNVSRLANREPFLQISSTSIRGGTVFRAIAVQVMYHDYLDRVHQPMSTTW